MRYSLLFFLILCCGVSAKSQSWAATNLTSVTYLPITGAESHHDQLYATVFNGFTASLYRLQSNNTAWDVVTTESISTPRFLRSAGSKMYMTTVESGVASMVYYTADDCATFVLDTVGLPPYFGYTALIYGLQYFDGKVIANVGSGGYYLKDTLDTAWHAIPVVTALNGGVDPIAGVNHILFAYDNTGTHTLYRSDDYGSSWNAVTTNLPADYGTSRLIGDDTNDRLYSAGMWNNSTESGIYYSDDLGVTWTLSAEATAFIGTNAVGNIQQVTAMYANGNTFYMALENDANASSPDVVGTTTGLQNLAEDVNGLPTDAASSINGAQFIMHDNTLVLHMNTTDVYMKNGGGNLTEEIHANDGVVVYPNPFSDQLLIRNTTHANLKQVNIYNPCGQLIWSGNNTGRIIDTSNFSSGSYVVELVYNDDRIVRRVMIK